VATSRAYGGVPAEQRRAQRRAALIGAGLDIVGAGGAARLTVAGLCARAGLNERYFYENFAALDDVLLAVHDDVVTELTAAIVTAVAGAPDDARAKARAAIAAAVQLLNDARKTRVLFVEPLAAPVLNARRADVSRAFVALVVGQAHDFYGATTALRIGSWADFAAAHLVGGFAETLSAWLRGDLDLTREELIERTTELFVVVAEHLVGPSLDPRAREGAATPEE
jgi:AcrR family transcriptional regulator